MPVPETDSRPFPAVQDLGQPTAPADPAAASGTPDGQAGFPDPAPTLLFQSDAAERAAMSVPATRHRRSLVLGLAVFAAMALAAFIGLHAAFHRPVQARAVPSVLRPASPPVAMPPIAMPPAPGPASPAQTVPSDPDRSTLPAAPPSRVVIHVPAGSEGAEAISAHLRAGLGSRLGAVEARRVADTPNRPSIRYFHPGDEPAAHQVAAWMADAGLIWTLQDFSTFLPRPSRGTIEVWLPRS